MYSMNSDPDTTTRSASMSNELNPSSPLVRDTFALDLQTQLIELQRENGRLQKDIDAKETKLNSSMRSIKMFWSPELKKERSARKAEAEKYATLKEQFNVVSQESQQRTEIIQDLQVQLKKSREGSEAMSRVSPASSISLLSSQEDIHREVESLRLERERQENEGYVLQKSLDELSTRLENQHQALLAKDETIARLMEMIKQNKGEDNKMAEQGKGQQEAYQKKLADVVSELEHLRAGIEERDRAITALQEEMDHLRISNVSEELQQSANMLTKDSQIADLTHQITILEQQIAEHKTEETKKTEDKKQAEVYQSHSQFLKSKVESMKSELAKKEAALTASEAKLETFKAHQSDKQQHISVLQSSLQAKDHHIRNLQSELESLRNRLDDREASLKDKDKVMQSLSSEHSENSYAVQNLKSVIETKERQLSNLRDRCETLESELCDKDTGISSIRAQLSSLRAEHQDSATTINNLEATIRDKDKYIEMLQSQRQRNGMEQQEEILTVKRNNEKLESKLELLKDDITKKKDFVFEKETELKEVQSSLKEVQSSLKEVQSSLKEKEARLGAAELKVKKLELDLEKSVDSKDEVSSELSSKKLEVSRLEKELRTARHDLENTKVNIESEESETVVKLKSECSAKEEQVENLERQLKEQSKKFANLKRNQQVEREKQAQLLNDVKKQGNENDERVDEIKKDLTSREERIAVLEEALTESVTIAAEREELLAQQAQSAESAAQRVEDVEMELERGHIEMAITNTKNASLLLALNENDAILNYYKTERRHMLEEVLEMRQNALLATISEKDANIALLEMGPTKNSEQEVAVLKREKDKLVTELKEQTQKRMTLITNEDNAKEVHLSMELSQAPKDKVLDAVALIEDSMEKLQLYGDDLLDVAKSHFPEVTRKLDKPKTRDYGKYENIINDASQKERLSFLETLEKDMQGLQDYIHKMLELIEDMSDH